MDWRLLFEAALLVLVLGQLLRNAYEIGYRDGQADMTPEDDKP